LGNEESCCNRNDSHKSHALCYRADARTDRLGDRVALHGYLLPEKR
jgi:hypothetical protein